MVKASGDKQARSRRSSFDDKRGDAGQEHNPSTDVNSVKIALDTRNAARSAQTTRQSAASGKHELQATATGPAKPSAAVPTKRPKATATTSAKRGRPATSSTAPSRKPRGKAAGSYHHGDLRRTLLQVAATMVREEGVEALNLRSLAARAGVSQTALYHHFHDKQELLCAVGEDGIKHFSALLDLAIRGRPTPATLTDAALGSEGGQLAPIEGPIPPGGLERFTETYVRFAIANPELYELMLGRTTWRGGTTESFRNAARGTFRAFAELMHNLQTRGELPAEVNSLRLAQVVWGLLHGLVRMHNDSLVFTPANVEEISRYAATVLKHIRLP